MIVICLDQGRALRPRALSQEPDPDFDKANDRHLVILDVERLNVLVPWTYGWLRARQVRSTTLISLPITPS